ncbi:MAG: hypothetical protein H0T68_08195 [Gemmatimonadales bacterium]|nr:hypothetical protein [Gemmatimonadales bacterium]MBA3556100.1 hypothetical protein [Gemmatimonadales bacterium]
MSLLLAGAVVSLLGWVLLAFVTPVVSGVIHLLLAVGTTLLVAWWALRE